MGEQLIDKNATIRIQSSYLAVDMDGDKVAMNMDNDQFYGINSVGSLIWNLIEEQEMTVGSLCTILSEQFSQNDPDQIKQDVVSFLDECEERGIVLID